jgi:hypothetical protein
MKYLKQTTIPQTINKKTIILETNKLETSNNKLETANAKLKTSKKEKKEEKKEEEEKEKKEKYPFGIITEKACCNALNIKFDGKFKNEDKYLEDIYIMTSKLVNLAKLFVFVGCIMHTAKNGGQYDFTCGKMHLSIKTNTTGYKICPQVIGQPGLKQFCEAFCNGKMLTHEQIKEFITCKENIPNLMKSYFEHTFDCAIVYCHKKENYNLLVETKYGNEIDWTKYTYGFTHETNKSNNYIWAGSSTSIQINGNTMGEFQIHNNRNSIQFRWDLKNLVKKFPECFIITNINTLKPFTF